MALIKDEDIDLVRERASIEDIVGEHVTLKRSGSQLKGLCPFHDEKGASFYVNPSKNVYSCFGCGEGGDVIKFVRQIEGVGFVEAIERLADRLGIELHYTEDAGDAEQRAAQRGQRTRLLDAHKAAAAFYVEQLASPEALIGRKFLADRGFGREAAEMFGIGYSPNTWDALIKHLTGKGFTRDELVTAGLALVSSKDSSRIYDAFRGRLMWPIRDTSGDIVGFGARKLYDNDQGPKFLNTNETPIYKKSKVLFGLDLARKHIANKKRVVVVEGYADVMAMHLSGEQTAVATCGTAFGEDHVKVVRRLIDDSTGSTGEIIYTFDGDGAGQKAALRAYELDSAFQTRTFVAVEPDGLDPCDVRIAKGSDGVLELIENRVPLFKFVMNTTLAKYQPLDSPEARTNALNACAPVLASIKDDVQRMEYARTLARYLRMPVEHVIAAVTNKARTGDNPQSSSAAEDTSGLTEMPAAGAADGPARPNPRDLSLGMERETLRLLIQKPAVALRWLTDITDADFAHPAYRAVYTAVSEAARTGKVSDNGWMAAVQARTPHESVRALVTELAVEPDRTVTTTDGGAKFDTDALAHRAFLKVAEDGTTRRIAEVSAALNAPGISATERITRSTEIVALNKRKKALRARGNTI